jgi:L-asparaginase
MKPHLAIFFTGGTISMQIDSRTGGAIPALSGKEIIARVPALEEIADFEVRDFARLAGPHMTPSLMMDLAGQVRTELERAETAGAVVTHGTDTLEETAYLLDLILNSEKPVVFVGAMRNSSELSWDGPGNLRSAVRVAADPGARGLGVLVVMNDQVLSGSEAVKTHTEAPDTFRGRDFGPLGIIDKDRLIVSRRRSSHEHIPVALLEEKVEIVKISAGSDGRLIDFLVDDGARGLVIEGLGRGNVTRATLPSIDRAIAKGLPVVITSRCPHGRVLDTYAYEGAGRQLRRMGVILGGLLPSHKARIKLMVTLGAGWDVARIRESFEGI